MNKSELKKYIGQFGCIEAVTSKHFGGELMILHGTLESVEDKNVLFRDTHEHIHIFPLVKSFTPEEFVK